jgi:hypothetical protein
MVAVSKISNNGTIVSGFKALAVDGNAQTVVYSLLDNASGRFAIDSSSGLIMMRLLVQQLLF